MPAITSKIYNNGQYVYYKPIKDKTFIYNFITDKCFSNHSNLNKSINTLVNYEEKNTRSKNYCIFLRIMYPKDLSKNQRHDFVKKFMFEVSMHYKKILFVYKFSFPHRPARLRAEPPARRRAKKCPTPKAWGILKKRKITR